MNKLFWEKLFAVRYGYYLCLFLFFWQLLSAKALSIVFLIAALILAFWLHKLERDEIRFR